MKIIRKILFPTDFSENAQNAFRYALHFADQLGAKIQVLHVILPEYEALDLPIMAMQATQQRMEAAKLVMKEFVDFGLTQMQVANKLQSMPEIASDIEIGGISDAVTTIARRDEIDLIMLGTKGQHNRVEKILGSVAASVVANAPCHVLVVPEAAELKDIAVVAYATDLHSTDPYNIWKAAQILEPFHPLIHCIHVSTQEEDHPMKMEELESFFEQNAPALQITFKEIGGKSIPTVLNEFIENFDVDLLTMASPQRGMIERIFHQSLTRRMALYSQVPLLVVRE